jgi:hypothetical protein
MAGNRRSIDGIELYNQGLLSGRTTYCLGHKFALKWAPRVSSRRLAGEHFAQLNEGANDVRGLPLFLPRART